MWPLSVGMAGLQEVSHNASLCFSCVLRVVIVLCLTAGTRGLTMAQAQDTVDVFPVDPSFHLGSNITLTCTIRQPSSLLARDLRWSRDGVALTSDLYSALNDQTSRLVVLNAQFADAGLYACLTPTNLPENSNETQVYIGVPPSRPVDFTCFCYNFVDVTCTWTVRGNTNLNTTHTLQFTNIENPLWTDCKGEECFCPDAQSCTLKGTVHGPATFRVLASNGLGRAVSDSFDFDIEKETVPYPPGNLSVRPIERSRLNVSFNLPAEWKTWQKNHLLYKLQYWQKGSDVQTEYLPEFPSRLYVELPSPGSLEAYTIYCVRVAARVVASLPTHWSDWSPTVCQHTMEQEPNAKINASWISQDNAKNDLLRDVVLKWQPLAASNVRGILSEYRVFDATDPHSTFKKVATLKPDETSYVLSGLERYKKYRFALEAVNGAGTSPTTILVVPAEYQSTLPVAVVVAVILVSSVFVVGAVAAAVYCIKHSRLLKPVPSISFIALDRFDRVLSRPIQRGMAEREVFDEPPGHRTPNGVLPDASHRHSDDPEAGAARAEEGDEYVRLRGGPKGDEGLPLLESSEGATAGGDDALRLLLTNGDSPSSTDAYVVKPVCPVMSAGVVPGHCGKFGDKLFVELPAPTGLNQPRLDSTDSGFADNCTEYRMPSYSRMSIIPADSDMDEAPSSGRNRDADTDSVDSGSDVYHRLAAEEPVSVEDQLNQITASMNRNVPAYTRLSSIPNVLFNGMPPSLGDSALILDSNGNVPSASLPSIDRAETGNS